MDYKRVLTIQDISCVGQCSLTVALPILSACGLETAILPSAVLSTHTGGFKGYTFRDLTDDIPLIAEHWQKEKILFDVIYTGYLGSEKQIAYVEKIMVTAGKPGCLKVVDPAMADNGKLYPAFDESYVDRMKSLCGIADIVVPNITEACFLTGVTYKSEYTKEYIETLVNKLVWMGAKSVVLTGVGYRAGHTGVVTFDKGKLTYYEHEQMAKGCHGTGDVFASAFVGALACGKSMVKASEIAADYTLECIKVTNLDGEHWYGAEFEKCLPSLIEKVR